MKNLMKSLVATMIVFAFTTLNAQVGIESSKAGKFKYRTMITYDVGESVFGKGPLNIGVETQVAPRMSITGSVAYFNNLPERDMIGRDENGNTIATVDGTQVRTEALLDFLTFNWFRDYDVEFNQKGVFVTLVGKYYLTKSENNNNALSGFYIAPEITLLKYRVDVATFDTFKTPHNDHTVYQDMKSMTRNVKRTYTGLQFNMGYQFKIAGPITVDISSGLGAIPGLRKRTNGHFEEGIINNYSLFDASLKVGYQF